MSSEQNGQVTRIDPATDTVVAAIDVGRQPRHVGLGFGSVWVTNYGSAGVTRIDPGTNEVVATIDVRHGPEGIAFSGADVWVANTIDNTLSRVSADTNAELETFDSGWLAEGLIFAPDGLLWVTVTGEARVVSLDPASGEVTSEHEVGR